MINHIFSFIFTHFTDAILIFCVGMFTKALSKHFGNDRAEKIKDTIWEAMLWAEETFGIGNGSEKFKAAWNKIKDLLKVQNIKLKSSEEQYVRELMLSHVPEINSITYSAMPEKVISNRPSFSRSPEITVLINKLKNKHPELQK